MKYQIVRKPTDAETALLQRCAHADENIARAAQREFASALTTPLKQGVLKGDILAGIFESTVFNPSAVTEYPLDFLAPGTEKDFVAYTAPNVGRITEHNIEGDFITVPTFRITNAIDWNLRYARDARWDIVGRAMQVLEASFTRKDNATGAHVLLASADSRNQVVYDDAAVAGLFTKRLVGLMQNTMRRLSGGNSTSTNRGKMTDLWISPEGHMDVLSWDLTQIPDAIRQQIYMNWDEGGVGKIGSVLLHDIDELGVAQEYQLYCENTLGTTLPTDKVEFVLGMDLMHNDSFVHPIRTELEVFEDMAMHRSGRAGVYAWKEHGYASLDSRRLLFGAF